MKNVLYLLSLVSFFLLTGCLEKGNEPTPSHPTVAQVDSFKLSNLKNQTWVMSDESLTLQNPQKIDSIDQNLYTFRGDSIVMWGEDLLPDSQNRDSIYLGTCSENYFINDSLTYSHIFLNVKLIRYNDTLFTILSQNYRYINFIKIK